VDLRDAGDAGIARRGVQLGHVTVTRERPGKRMLAAARADYQDPHPAEPTLAGLT
jgi:hypothetical protein